MSDATLQVYVELSEVAAGLLCLARSAAPSPLDIYRNLSSICFWSDSTLQAYVELLEAAGGLLCLALAPHCTFLPRPYVRALLCSPVIGQDPLHANQLQLHAVSDLWSGIGHRVRAAAANDCKPLRSATHVLHAPLQHLPLCC